MTDRQFDIAFGITVVVIFWMLPVIVDFPESYFVSGWFGCVAYNAYRNNLPLDKDA